MSRLSKADAKKMLKSSGLRSTGPRLAVLRVLSIAAAPMSHSEVIKQLGKTDWDPATIYRNLIKLRDANLGPCWHRRDRSLSTHPPSRWRPTMRSPGTGPPPPGCLVLFQLNHGEVAVPVHGEQIQDLSELVLHLLSNRHNIVNQDRYDDSL